jgi:hypothetical protein
MGLRSLYALGAVLLATVAPQKAVSAQIEKSSASAQSASIQRAIDRGRTMYLFDRAAWVTSDDLVPRLSQERAIEIGGWVVTQAESGLHVDYFGKDADADHVIYSADVNDFKVSNATVYPVTAEPVLTGPALQMAHALRAAWTEMGRHAEWQPCAPAHFNTIVLPAQADGTIPVYFLTPQTTAGSYPFGGHYEVDVGADGHVAFTRSFARSCIDLRQNPSDPPGKIAMMFITHLLDSQPTEIHVFEQYYVGVPIVVGIPKLRSIWKVESGTIEDVTDMVKQ